MSRRFSVETIVELVVNTAKTDTTAPDPDNPRNGWITDMLLTQIIDRLVVGSHNEPSVYAEIARKVLARIGNDLPEAAMLARLAILRAEVFFPIKLNREQLILQMIDELERNNKALPDGLRKKRCQSLFSYHRGYFYETYGRFDLAAKFQQRSAEEAFSIGDVSSGVIGRFMAFLCELRQDLVERRSATELNERFDVVARRLNSLITNLRGTVLETQWAEANGPIYMIEACIWLDRIHPEWEEWVATALSATAKLGDSWNLCADFIRTVAMEKQGNPQAAESALRAIADSDDIAERRAAALLILIRHAHKEGQAEQVRRLMDLMPDQGAQHVRAVAQRYL